MYTASKPHVLAAQWVAWLWVRSIGPALFPGRTERIESSFLPDLCRGLELPVDGLTSLAHYRRRDSVREGVTLVAVGRQRSVLVKIRGSSEGLRTEQQVLAKVRAAAPTTFRVPEAIGLGQLPDGRYWSAQQMVFSAPHRPCASLPNGFMAELEDVLRTATDLSSADHPSWTPAHGDLTPWNLRYDVRGRCWLFDWEDVCLAPPGADAGYFGAALGVIRPKAEMARVPLSVARFWSDRITARLGDGHPKGPNSTMLQRLKEGSRA